MKNDYISANAQLSVRLRHRLHAYAAAMPNECFASARTPHELRSLCVLARAPGLDADALQTAVARFGSLDALLAADAANLRATGIRPAAARALTAPDALQIDRDLRAVEQFALELLPAHESIYPAKLREIADAPAVLFVRGAQAALAMPQLAIVGSRNPTANGRETARDFAHRLAQLGLGITSGLAVGIDAAAHEGALLAGGTTIAVCATGLDLTYPPHHTALAERIAAAGALISEFPPGTPPLPHHFPQRNRLISGLARGVLVVEAARRSGSLATARCAGEQGRDVFAIPGSIHSPLSHGCHALIRQGAKLVENVDDILTEIEINHDFHTLTPMLTQPTNPPDDGSVLDNPGEILLDALGFEPTSVDTLIASTGLSSTSVASLLLALELEGRVASDGLGRYYRVMRLSPGGPTA